MTRRALFFLSLAALAFPSCRSSLDPDQGKFHCATDGDCGSGWHCDLACHQVGFSPYCIVNGDCDPCPDLGSDPKNCGSCGHACAAAESCLNGTCLSTSVDGGEDAGRDAGHDAGDDAGLDAGRDAGEDAGLDGGPSDAGLPDGSFDAGADAGADAGTDGGGDAGLDGGADAGDAA
ncbi:MAG: hypothetical protein ACYCWW_09540 [Deltaproteobacteria bacterium]